MTETANNNKTKGNMRIVMLCAGLVAGMGGLAYASVPLYQLFCQVTGYGGTTQRVEDVEGIPVLDRQIKVRFDSNTASGLDWSFAPAQREVVVRLGEKMVINYVAENLSAKPVSGMATFNVTPQAIGAYFNKIECFCFTDTEIAPGGKIDMPVVFFIDPELDSERAYKALKTITLSYTFYESGEEKLSQVKPETDTGGNRDQKL